jgi:hypothetical protein
VVAQVGALLGIDLQASRRRAPAAQRAGTDRAAQRPLRRTDFPSQSLQMSHASSVGHHVAAI